MYPSLPRLALLVVCFYLCTAQDRRLYDYLPPDPSLIPGPSGNGFNIIPFPTTTTPRSRTTRPPRVTHPPMEHHDHHHHHHSSDPLDWLRESVPGEPGNDYPIYDRVPRTEFSCEGRALGMYADLDSRCQVMRTCIPGPGGKMVMHSLLCPNGTVWDQELYTCVWWNRAVNCQQSEQYYRLNANLGQASHRGGEQQFFQESQQQLFQEVPSNNIPEFSDFGQSDPAYNAPLGRPLRIRRRRHLFS